MAFVIAEQDAFDLQRAFGRRGVAAIGQGQKQLLGAVVILAVDGDFGRPDLELRR